MLIEVNFQQELQKAKSKFSEEEITFVKEHYEKTESGNYILYAYRLRSMPSYITEIVDILLRKGMGIYTAQCGHIVPSALIN